MASVDNGYETFELLIGAHNGTAYPLTVTDSPGGEANGLCVLDPQDYEIREALASLEERALDAEGLRQVAQYLFESIFPGDVEDLFRSSLNLMRGQDKRLRIRLRIDAPELATLPWEYMLDSVEDRFLATSAETVLFREIPLRLPARPTTLTLPMRILVVVSNPQGVQALDTVKEQEVIRSALAEQIQGGRIEVQFVTPATIANINQAMRQFRPHVFHFIGHGLFENDEACLVLEEEDGSARLINERDFREFFAGDNETRIAVLNACQTATVSSSKPLVGLAPRLLQRQLSGVVAMQFPLQDKAALIFSREFYRSLALGYGVDTAVADARRGILMELGGQTIDWGVPVLFLRAKDGNLFAIDTPAPVTAAEAVSPPPEPLAPPASPHFVGREMELAHYGDRLAQTGLALIGGMAGVGKSALAAQLAVRQPDSAKVFWYSFHEGEGVESIIWNLAGFLAWHGKADIWQMLQGKTKQAAPLPPPDVLLNYLFQAMKGMDFLLCLDDFQFVDDDPMLEKLAEKLRPLVFSGQVRLLITSRRVPRFFEDPNHVPLQGMTLADTTLLLASQKLTLALEQLQQLHERTEGNPELLILSVSVLRKAVDVDRTIAQLATAANVETFLLDEVDKELAGDQRGVMSGIAALLGYRGTPDAIESVLDSGNVRRTLAYLVNHYLLSVQDGETDREYGQHATVQTFYYKLLSRSQRTAMHQRAATYYRDVEHNELKALLHFQHAGAYTEAVALLEKGVWALINQGRLRPVRTALAGIPLRGLSAQEQARVWVAIAQLDSYLGDPEASRSGYTQADALLGPMGGDFQTNRLRGQVARGMAFLLRERTPAEALDWAQKGLAQIAGKDPIMEADLLTMAGTIYRRLGRMDEARTALIQALDLQSPLPTHQRLLTQLALGNLYFYLGEVGRSRDFLLQAEQIGLYLHDHINLLAIWGSLAACDYILGNWDSAAKTYEKAIRRAGEMDSAMEQTIQRMNYGVLLTQRRDFAAAGEHLTTALAVARQTQWTEALVACQLHLAALHLDQDQPDQAEPCLAEARQLAQEEQITYQMTTVHFLTARLLLARANPSEAEGEARLALESAQALGMRTEEGQAWRVLGQALATQGEKAQAAAAYEQSLACLQGNPYEEELTLRLIETPTA